MLVISNPMLIPRVLETDMFLDKACIALELVVKGLRVFRQAEVGLALSLALGLVMATNPCFIVSIYSM